MTKDDKEAVRIEQEKRERAQVQREWWDRLNSLTTRLGGLPGDQQLDVVERAAALLESIQPHSPSTFIIHIEPNATTAEIETIEADAVSWIDRHRKKAIAGWTERIINLNYARRAYSDEKLKEAKRREAAWGSSKAGSIKIIEYLCHACGQHAMDVRSLCETRRRWMCPCGTKWTGGKVGEPYVSLPIEERMR